MALIIRLPNGTTFSGRQFIVVGRHPNCDWCLHNNGISRHHCILQLAEDHVCVRDLGSTNGTWVKGVRLGKWPVTVVPGDNVSLAQFPLHFEQRNGILVISQPSLDPAPPFRNEPQQSSALDNLPAGAPLIVTVPPGAQLSPEQRAQLAELSARLESALHQVKPGAEAQDNNGVHKETDEHPKSKMAPEAEKPGPIPHERTLDDQ